MLNLLFALIFLLTSPGLAEENESVQIENADTLSIEDDRIILEGNVSVKSSEAGFTLRADRLIGKQDSNGEYSRIETFGKAKISAQSYEFTAGKFIFLRNPKLRRFDKLEAKDSVRIISKDGDRQITAPQADVNLIDKRLFLSGGVDTEQQIHGTDGQSSRAHITSDEQVIDLAELNDSTPRKQLNARGNCLTTIDGIRISSANTEIFTRDGSAERAVFIGNAKLTNTDGTVTEGQRIEYSFAAKKLFVYSGEEGLTSVLRIPYTETDGSKGELIIRAASITNEDLNAEQNLLVASQGEYRGLVNLEYGSRRGWAKQLFVLQNKAVPNRQEDYLLLIDEAHLLDPEASRELHSDYIRIGLGDKRLSSGSQGRAKGTIQLRQQDAPSTKRR